MKTAKEVEEIFGKHFGYVYAYPRANGYDVSLGSDSEIAFSVFLELAVALGTRDIIFSVDTGSDCPTCGGGVESEVAVRWRAEGSGESGESDE